MSFPWYRFYTEAIHDRKLQRAGAMAGLSHCEAVGAWAILLALANDSPGELRGWLYIAPGYPLGLSDLAKAWVVDEAKAKIIVEAFEAMGLIHLEPHGQHGSKPAWQVPAWQGRQFISDSSTKRTRAYRQRKREQEEKDRQAYYKRLAQEQARQAQEDEAQGQGTSQERHSDAPDQNRSETEAEQSISLLDEAWEKFTGALKVTMMPASYQSFSAMARPLSLDEGQLLISMPFETNPRLLKQLEQANQILGAISPIKSIAIEKREGANP